MQLFHNECCIREEKMSKDLRNIKTKENIESHFINLLERYKFQDITIKLLINECQINRSTFYRNYEDKYDLIYKIVEELIKQLKKNIHCQFITLHLKKENDFKPYFSSLLDYFNKHKDIFIVLYNNDLPINIFDEMLTIYSHYLLNELIYHYHISDSQIKIANYFSKIIASNILVAIKWWHLESPQTSKEEILQIITITITEGILASLQSQFL